MSAIIAALAVGAIAAAMIGLALLPSVISRVREERRIRASWRAHQEAWRRQWIADSQAWERHLEDVERVLHP